MSKLLSQLEQVMNFFEFPAFLLESKEDKFDVISLNHKLKTYSEGNNDFQKEISLENFLKVKFRFEPKALKKFIDEMNLLLKTKNSGSIQINSNDESYNFDCKPVSPGHQIFYFVNLVSCSVEKVYTSELELYKRVFESLPIGIALNNIDDSKSIYVNSKLTEIYGWDVKDLEDISTFFKKVYPDEDYRNKISKMVMEDIYSKDPERMQWDNIKITTKSGLQKTINAKNIPLYDSNLMISTITDVTENYQIQEKLENANSRFNLALQATSDAVWEWVLDKKELYWGDGYERLFGYKIKDNTVTKAFWESKIHPNDFEPFFDSLQQALDDKQLYKWTFNYRFLNTNGKYANVRENVLILRDDEGKPLRLVGALQDITKALKRETHLDLLEKLIAGTKDAILVSKITSDSFLKSEIIFANSSFQNLFGYKPTDILGKATGDFLINKKNASIFQDIEFRLKDWESLEENVLSVTKDDIEFWHNLFITPIMDDQGWYTHWMIVNKNVSDEKTNFEKRELLSFAHQVFQGDELLQNLLCKIAMKIESLVRSAVCEFWLVDYYSQDLSRFLTFANGKEVEDSKEIPFDYKSFVKEIQSTPDPLLKIHSHSPESPEHEQILQSFGFQIISQGQSIGVIVVGFPDLYSRKQTLQSIFDEFSIQLGDLISKKRFEKEINTFFENTPDFLCIAGKDGFLRRINKRASDKLGFSQKVFLSTPFLKFVAEEDHQKALDLMEKARDNKSYFFEEIKILDKDSRILKVDWTVFSLEGSDDIFCVGRDVTEYRAILSSLKTQVEKFKILSRTVKDAVWDFDLVTEKITWGSGLETLFGYDPEFFGTGEQDWLDKLHPNDKSQVNTSLKEAIRQKDVFKWKKEYRFLKSDGTYVDVLDRGTIMRNSDGDALRMVGSILDISEFKEYSANLERLNNKLMIQTDALKKSNRDLEEFAYIASHDLQEPLRMVVGFLSRLEDKYGEDLDDKAKEYINFAVDGARRMRQIIHSLLNFSKVGQQNVSWTEVDVSILIEDVKLLLHESITEKNALIEVGNIPKIFSVEGELKEVFLNLIDNAIKYSKENNRPIVKINYSEMPNYHIFTIEDNGIGISEEYFEKIFGIFQRLHGQSEYSGTGIGLAIVKKIIENLNGSVNLTSELSKGTTFSIQLPKKQVLHEEASNS